MSGVRLAVFGFLTTAVLCLGVAGAGAYVTASVSQRTAMDQVVAQWWQAHDGQCEGSDKLGFLGAEISTANALYGQAEVDDNSCTYSFGYFVRRTSPTASDWEVIGNFPDSAEECSFFAHFLPANVISDYKIGGLTGPNSGIHRCVTTAPTAPTRSKVPKDPCTPYHGSVALNLLRAAECTKDQTVIEAKCGVEASAFILPALKYLGIIRDAKSIEVIGTLPEKVRPMAEFLYRVDHATILKNAPEGYQTTGEIMKEIEGVQSAKQLIFRIPKIYEAIGARQFLAALGDLADAAGLNSCVKGLRQAATS
jgi:hypothetical protein